MSVRHCPFSIAISTNDSLPIDIGPRAVICGLSIHGTWTASKIQLKGYVPESSGAEDFPWNSSTALYDVVEDHTGQVILLGNGTDTSGIFIAIPDYLKIVGSQYWKVSSLNTQAQAVHGFVLTWETR